MDEWIAARCCLATTRTPVGGARDSRRSAELGGTSMGWLDRGSRSIRGDKIESRAKAYPSNVIDMLIVSEGKSGSSGQTITGPTLDPRTVHAAGS